MEITREQAKEKIFNKEIIKLLVEDFEYGYAMDEESNDYFRQSVEEKVKDITSSLGKIVSSQLEKEVKAILESSK